MLQFIAVVPFGLLKLFQPFHYQASVIRNWQLNQRNLHKKIPTLLGWNSLSNFTQQQYCYLLKLKSKSKYSEAVNKQNLVISEFHASITEANMTPFLSVVQISMKWVKANKEMHTNCGSFIYLFVLLGPTAPIYRKS